MNTILGRRAIARAVALEERVEALEAAVEALLAEVRGRKPGFVEPPEVAAVRARVRAAAP